MSEYKMRVIFKTLFLLTISIPLVLMAQPPTTTYNSQSTSGDWKTNAKWDQGSWPAHNQTNGSHIINITNDHKITLTDVLYVKSGTEINVTADDTLEIIGNVTFANGSVVNVNSGGVLKITGNVTNNNNSNTITIDGLIDITGNFNGGNGSEINGNGTMTATGTITTDGSGTVFGTTDDCMGSGGCTAAPGGVLPVELISFEANTNGNHVELMWVTGSEINNAYFTIERSTDGKEWEEVLTTNGAGNSNQVVEYFETDYNPLNGVSYYRLRQTDFDGIYKYFNIVPVKFIKNSNGNISLFPNPLNSGETVTIEFTGIETHEFLIVMRDVTGKEFYSKMMVNIENGTLVGVPTETDIPAGIYIITATSENQIYSQKLLIKKTP
ncbi:MAG: T9SS type A sorting domain-containing protein [Vicingus serpentipes]|nr:T9SS type A sorting domain-containing protein [Vicingus serpentipes]